jgi:hypothetical protein
LSRSWPKFVSEIILSPRVFFELLGRALLLPATFSVLLCGLTHGAADRGGLAPARAVLHWNSATLQGIRDAKLSPPVAARALAIVHTCMFDAWAAYDDRAIGTQLAGALRRPASERTLANKERAISYAAYRALADVLPVDTNSIYIPLMRQLGYDPNDNSTDIETPTGIGNVACAAVLEYRHHDKSNHLGDLAQGPYSDWTNYRPINSPGTVPAQATFVKPLNPEHWQPLTYTDASGNLTIQMFDVPQWNRVAPFALTEADQFRQDIAPAPFRYGSVEYEKQSEELIALSAGLTDEQKMLAEYWSDYPGSEGVIGHWERFAQFISERDHHTLDDDVKMFFTLSNALLDSSIAAWDAKRETDSVRPVTAIPLLFRGKNIHAWGGPGKGTSEMDGSRWIPYQPATFPTPPSPDYVSEESAFSSAAAEILQRWTGSTQLGDSTTFAARSSKIEPGTTPVHPVTLRWETFANAANKAGMSGRYGGIHFQSADLAGRELGRSVAAQVWAKAQTYFGGNPAPAR